MIRINSSIWIILLLGSLVACKKRDPEVPYSGTRYFPLQQGNYILYDVDSIVYDAFNQSVDTLNFKIKMMIGDPYTDAEGNPGFKVLRYFQLSDTLDFKLQDVWYARKTRRNVEQVEENKRYVKLALPPGKGTSWDGNSKNDLPTWDYYIKDLHIARNINGHSFDSTLTVVQYDDKGEVLTQSRYSEEKYASGIGMVYYYREWIDNVYDNSSSQFVPSSGYKVKWSLVDYKISQ